MQITGQLPGTSREVNTPQLITADQRFLVAWKEGIALIGNNLFACSAPDHSKASHWRAIPPRLDAMRKVAPNRSRADAGFMAAMASFYNAVEGQKLLNKVGCSFGDLAMVLSVQQRDILAVLLLNYRGW